MLSPSEEEAQTAQGWLDRIRPEDRRQVIAYAQECMVQAKDFQLEYRVVHQKGEIRHILATGYFKKDGNGESSLSYELVLDSSNGKRMEAENLHLKLLEQQRLLYAILEAQEEEHRRISESLHKGVGQILYATRLHLERGMLRHGLPLREGLLSSNLFQPAGSEIKALQTVKLR